MSTSQNGWPAPPHRTRKWMIPGTGRHLVLVDGPAGLLLVHLALWFHERIERLDLGIWDEWGYAYRPVTGSSTTLSNHASATAADLNATRHPYNVATGSTFTRQQQRRIRRRLRRLFRRLIRWGGDYRNTPDAMHFEIVGRYVTVRRLARVLAKTPRGRRVLAANPGAKEALK